MKSFNLFKNNFFAIIFLICIFNFDALSQIVTFNDINFKNALLSSSIINTNLDAEIQVSEANSFAGAIDVNGLNITDLTGIENFVLLTELNVNNNQLTALNLGFNVNLINLYCNNNMLTNLDLTSNFTISILSCNFNSLTNLDLVNNTALTNLSCTNNLLTNLNIKNANNLSLSLLDATQNPNLYCVIVDDVAYMNTTFPSSIDPQTIYSTICCSINVQVFGPTTFCEGNSVMLVSSSASNNFWNNGETNDTLIVTQSGSYTTMVSHSCGVENSIPVNVIVNALPIVDAGADQTKCENDLIVLTGTGAQTYNWDFGVIDGSPFTHAPGFLTFTVVGTDVNGCQNTDQVNVTVNALPFVNAGIDQTVCGGSFVTLSGSGALFYSWENGVIDATPFQVGSTGNYIVTGTDVNSCQSKDTVKVFAISAATPSIVPSGPLTFCQGNNVDLTSSPAISYLWSNGESGQTTNISISGAYFVAITDANGCVANSDTVNVVINSLPPVFAGIDATLCENSSYILSGSGAETYIWDNSVLNGNSFIPSVGTTILTVIGTDINGCQNSDQITFTVNALPIVNAGIDQTVCSGTNVTLSGNGAQTYIWDNGVNDGVSFVPNTNSLYTVTGTDANGCESTDQVEVFVNFLNSPTILPSGPLTFCEGNSVDLSVPTYNSYLWNDAILTQTNTITISGNYFVSVTDANGCVANSDTLQVVVNALPIVSAGIDQSICLNDNTILSGSGALTYNWDNGVLDGNSFTPVLGTTTYSVTGTDINGCVNTDQVDIVVNALPIVDAGLDQLICFGENVILVGSGAVTYSWDNGILDGIPFVASSNAFYNVTGIDNNGCIATDQMELMVTSLPSATISASGPLSICEGSSVELTSTFAESFSWNNAITTQSNIVSTAGIYYLSVTDLNGCVGFSDSVTVSVLSLPTVDAGIDQITCDGSAITLIGNGAINYTWDNGVIDGIPFTPAASGVYSLIGIDANSCSNSDVVNVTVNPLPIINAGSDLTICEGSNVTLNAAGASNYVWDNGVLDGVSFSVLATTVYTVVGTDVNGCQNSDNVLVTAIVSPTLNVNTNVQVCENSNLQLSASTNGSNVLWFNQVDGFELANSFVYDLNNMTTSTSLFAKAYGNGCFSPFQEIVITVNPNPVASINKVNTSCSGNNGSVEATIISGASPFTYYWNTGLQQSLVLDNLPTGTYYFNLEDANACKTIEVVEIIPGSIDVNATINNVSCFGLNDGSISIDVQGMQGEITYLWSIGGANSTRNDLLAGSYEVLIRNDANCNITKTFMVTQPEKITNSFEITQPNCGANDGVLLNNGTNGGVAPYTYLWDDGSNTASLNGISGGFYTLQTTDNNGCELSETFALSNFNAPIVSGQINQQSCNEIDGAIDLSIIPFNNDNVQSVVWSSGQNTEDITNLSVGNYKSFVTTTNNCLAVNQWIVENLKPATQELCLVSVDSVTTSNLIVWEKPLTTNIAYYNIYRESNIVDDYQLIDTVNFNNLSVFNDVIASPLVKSWRYKIAAVDVCGIESLLSAHHKTVNLNIIDLGVNGTQITWDSYEGNLSFSNYILWKYTDENQWVSLGSIAANVNSFIDNEPFLTEGLDYMIEVEIDEMCTATKWRAQDFNVSRSNKDKGIFNPGVGNETFSNNDLLEYVTDNQTLIVYPNPAKENLNVELISGEMFNGKIVDITGKKIIDLRISQGLNQVDLSNFQSGIYFLENTNSKSSKLIKFVVNK